LAQCRDQWCGGIDLANRDRVQPHAIGKAAAAIEREALAPAIEVLALPQPPPDQVIQRERQRDPAHQGIQAAQQPLTGGFMHGRRIAETLESVRARFPPAATAVAAPAARLAGDRAGLDARALAMVAGGADRPRTGRVDAADDDRAR